MTETRYARSGEVHIGYTILEGDTELDHTIMLAVGTNYPFESMLEEPTIRRFLDGLAALGRLVLFDRRGIGCSDGVADWETPLVLQWADDIDAVATDAGLEGVTLFADLAAPAVVWAARQPRQLDRLILWNYWSSIGPDDDWAPDLIDGAFANIEGSEDLGAILTPDRWVEPAFRSWSDRAGRAGASPATARRLLQTFFAQKPGEASDRRLAHVVDPTLLLVRRPEAIRARIPVEYDDRPMEHLPDARLVDLSPGDAFPLSNIDPVLAEVTAFVIGEYLLPPPERFLAGILFTDIVDSTAMAQAIGDSAWKRVLDEHDSVLRAAVGRHGGAVVKTTGDGVLATLPTASAAFDAALDVRAALSDKDLSLRLGVHVGEVDRRGDDVSGLAVNVGARVMSAAEPGQLLVSAMAMHSTMGQNYNFSPVGTRTLKGIDGEWDLFELV